VTPEVDWNRLLERCLGEGGPRDWRELVNAMVPVIRGTVPGGATRERIEDFAQELFFRLLEDDRRRLRMFDPALGVPFPAYLRVIAVRLRISLWRGRGERQREREVDLSGVAEILGIEPSVLRRLKIRELREAVDKLTPQQRLATHLLLDGLTVKEIARVLGLRDGGAASLLWRARQELRGLLG
jgi:RNA polymerase sigma factor (sigma-70 family)